MEISKEQYLAALEIVEAYHAKLNKEIALKRDKYDLKNLSAGDFIISMETKSNHITVGKKYELIRTYNVGHANWWGEIRDDNGKIKDVMNNNFKRWARVI